MDKIKYKFDLLKTAVETGDFSNVIDEVKQHITANKNIYVILTFLVILYVLYENDIALTIHSISSIVDKHVQSGGVTTPGLENNIAESPEKVNNRGKSSSSKFNNDNAGTMTSGNAAQMASGLCDGNGTIAKMCRGGKDGVYNYFKFFGYLVLAGLAILSPFVIYIVLVYMMLKIMFTGFKNM